MAGLLTNRELDVASFGRGGHRCATLGIRDGQLKHVGADLQPLRLAQ